jgi:hypothetical protein
MKQRDLEILASGLETSDLKRLLTIILETLSREEIKEAFKNSRFEVLDKRETL